MKRPGWLFAVFVMMPGWLVAQEPRPAQQQTVPPAAARFEIIYAPWSERFAFRLDRFSGQVARLVTSSDRERMQWEEMRIIGLPPVADAGAARFQLFMSGSDLAQSFLLDTATGETWRMVSENRQPARLPDNADIVWRSFGQ